MYSSHSALAHACDHSLAVPRRDIVRRKPGQLGQQDTSVLGQPDDDVIAAVLEAAAKQFGLGKDKPADGRGFGLACGTEKASFVATCAEVAVGASGAADSGRAIGSRCPGSIRYFAATYIT